MKKFGGNVSIKGALNALRVDIVESEEVVWPPRTAGKGREPSHCWECDVFMSGVIEST